MAASGAFCQLYGGTGPLDHATLWRTPERQYVLVGEPYHLAPDRLADFAADCKALGLEVWVTGASPYFPGWSVRVSVRKYEGGAG